MAFERALQEMKEHVPALNNVNVHTFIQSQKTMVDQHTLFYKTIPEGLFCLLNHVLGNAATMTSSFKTFGTMIDLSRNAVYRVSYMKSVIRRQALMGYNAIMLYTEDTYEVKSEPYFGYMRGKYSVLEINELVEYGKRFGVELIPCIQTLGHMGQFLRWGHHEPLKDLPTVLMTQTKEVYAFIEKCLIATKKAYHTSKIHIGMDETFGFGFGRFYKQFGYKPQIDIFLDHLEKVNQLCLKHGFTEVMIWSDMLYRMFSPNESYYNPDITLDEAIRNRIPKNVSLVYWDYYNKDKDKVKAMIQSHEAIKKNTIMASGVWIWTKLNYDKIQTDKTALQHIEACKETNVEDLYFTQWHDDGAPCNYETSFLGLYDMACKAFEIKTNKAFYEAMMKTPYESHAVLANLNACPIETLPLLWDDPLLGIYLNNEAIKNHAIYHDTFAFFNAYKLRLDGLDQEDENVKHTVLLTEVLALKVLIRGRLLEHYHNHRSMKDIIALATVLRIRIDELQASFRTLWLKRYKAFGLDVMQSRLATLSTRTQELMDRLMDYEAGLIDCIEELNEQVGPYQHIRMNHMNIAFSSIHVLS